MCYVFLFWFTSWSEKTSRLNPAERLTDLFPWRLCLVAGAAAAYLHTCRLCFSSQSRPWVRQGWGVPQHTWFQWPIPWLKTRSADLPQLRAKTGKRHRAQRTIKHPSVLEYHSPLKHSSNNFIFSQKHKTHDGFKLEDVFSSYFSHIPLSYNTLISSGRILDRKETKQTLQI